ncbi:MAG: ATP-binding protein [Planctomycetes bacterium]|nr:ATP-binding protein [Planctomycetota bacterium]
MTGARGDETLPAEGLDVLELLVAELEAVDEDAERGRELRALEAACRVALTAFTTLASGAGTEAVLRVIAAGAREITGADMAALGVAVCTETPFTPWVAVGALPEGLSPPRPRASLALGVGAERPVRLEDVRAHRAFQGFPAGHPALGPLLAVPVTFEGRRLATLFLGRRPGGLAFDEADERTVTLLAERAGVAVELAQVSDAAEGERSLLEAVVQQLPLGVVLLDGEARPRAVNEEALALAAHDRAAADPLHGFAPCSPDGEPLASARLPLSRALVDDEVVRNEALDLRRADGEVVPVLASASPLRGGGGAPAGFVATFQEVAAQRERERLRDEWAAVVAHDLRAAAGTIALSAEVLARTCAAATPQARAVELIVSAARRLCRMIDDLSDVSRLEARRMDVRPAPLDLAPLARDVAERVVALTPGLRVEVRAPGPVLGLADAQRLEQVLTNLLSNAAKYGARGEPVLLEAAAVTGGNARLSVTNRGGGIPADELPRVFDRFMRARAATGSEGLGLGLYISKGLVEAQGGRIWVESAPGEATTFHVEVPSAGS